MGRVSQKGEKGPRDDNINPFLITHSYDKACEIWIESCLRSFAFEPTTKRDIPIAAILPYRASQSLFNTPLLIDSSLQYPVTKSIQSVQNLNHSNDSQNSSSIFCPTLNVYRKRQPLPYILHCLRFMALIHTNKQTINQSKKQSINQT